MKTTAEVDPVNEAPGAAVNGPPDDQASFAETALKLGGKSEEEARRTGAIDKADDQVEGLFAARFQTVNSPIHRAVWERRLPAGQRRFGHCDALWCATAGSEPALEPADA